MLQPPSVTDPEFAEELKSLKPDLFVVVAFSILPAPLLTIPDRGAINLHASLLPQYRGAAPIHWAVSDGQTKTGLTVFSLKPSVDSGDILCQVPISIGPDETTGELYDRMKSVGAEAVVQVVDEIEKGTSSPVPQDDSLATKAPKLTKKDAEIVWSASPLAIHNLVRGTNPTPGAHTYWKGDVFGVGRVEPAEMSGSDSEPGSIIESDQKDGVLVSTTDGAVRLLEVQPAGKRAMNAAAWARGARPQVGDRFGQ